MNEINGTSNQLLSKKANADEVIYILFYCSLSQQYC